jgi:hypothetical protein
MTTYDIRLHREVLLTFYEVKADSPEDAASTARGFATGGADRIDDCNELCVRVDVADGDYRPPVTIDFEAERQRKAAPRLLSALEGALFALDENIDVSGPSKRTAITNALAAIAEAKAAGITPAPVEPGATPDGGRP